MNQIITISKLKHYPALSEVTNCFTCDVLLNGKKNWEAKNNGQGEQTRLYYLKPTTESGEQDADALLDTVDKLVSDSIVEKLKDKDKKAVARKFTKQLFFRVKGQKEYSYYHIKSPNPNDRAFREKVLSKHDVDVILNDLPIDQALPYFFKYE